MFGFLLGILFCIFILFIGALGASYGKQIAVDTTKSKGYFEAYGKKYQALEIETANGTELTSSPVRAESESK